MGKHYVIYAEWCIDYDAGHNIVGVYHTEEEAIAVFKKRVDSDERKLADIYGYKVYEDSDRCFDAGEEGEYVHDHVYIAIQEVEEEDSNGKM